MDHGVAERLIKVGGDGAARVCSTVVVSFLLLFEVRTAVKNQGLETVSTDPNILGRKFNSLLTLGS